MSVVVSEKTVPCSWSGEGLPSSCRLAWMETEGPALLTFSLSWGGSPFPFYPWTSELQVFSLWALGWHLWPQKALQS